MPRIASEKTIKNRKRRKIIEDSLSVGMSGNKIQKFLKEMDLGIQRKKLYEEIRSIEGKSISNEKRRKSIPKKYRKGGGGLIKVKFGKIYRGSLIISSVPLHSTPFNRQYLGFRLNVFSFSKNECYSALRKMRKQFFMMVGQKLKSFQYASEQVLGTENPTLINVSNPSSLNGKWFFAVEEKGQDTDSKSGYI